MCMKGNCSRLRKSTSSPCVDHLRPLLAGRGPAPLQPLLVLAALCAGSGQCLWLPGLYYPYLDGNGPKGSLLQDASPILGAAGPAFFWPWPATFFIWMFAVIGRRERLIRIKKRIIIKKTMLRVKAVSLGFFHAGKSPAFSYRKAVPACYVITTFI